MASLKCPVKGFEKALLVDEVGNIYSVDRQYRRSDTGKLCTVKGKLLRCGIDRCGYLKLRFSYEGHKYSIYPHRAVADTFIPNPFGLKQVNHRNGDKTENSYWNLEWCSNQDNQIHALQLGLSKRYTGRKAASLSFTTFAITIDKNELVAIMNGNEEMNNAGFDYRLVSAVVKGKRKSHKGCTFKRINT